MTNMSNFAMWIEHGEEISLKIIVNLHHMVIHENNANRANEAESALLRTLDEIPWLEYTVMVSSTDQVIKRVRTNIRSLKEKT